METPALASTPTDSAPPSCVGDCNGDRQVAINELLTIIDVALGQAPVSMCEAADVDGNGSITVDEILAAVNTALNGCSRLTAPCSVDESKSFQDCYPALAAETIQKTVRFGDGRIALAQECITWTGGRYDDPPGIVCANGLYADGADMYVPYGGLRYLAQRVPSASPEHYLSVMAADLDRDGCDDLVSVAVPTWFRGLLEGDPAAVDPTKSEKAQLQIWRGDCAWGLHAPAVLSDVALDLPEGTLVTYVTLLDVNRDGTLDVVFSYTSPFGDVSGTVLFLSDGTNHWVRQPDSAFAGGVPGAPGFALNPAFINADSAPDLLMLSGCFPNEGFPGTCALYLGTGTDSPVFKNESVVRVFDETKDWSPMGSACGDFDGDGIVECFVTDIRNQHYFLVHDASTSLSLEDVATQNGSNIEYNLPGDQDSGQFVGFDPYFVDLTRSGDYGLFIVGATDGGNHGLPYTHVLARENGNFRDVTAQLLGDLAAHGSTGMSVGDFDGDGRPDFLTCGNGSDDARVPEYEPQLLINRIAGGNSLALRLRGHHSNTDGIGARVTVTGCGKTSTQAMWLRRSTCGFSEPRLFFGLGKCNSAEHVVIEWPSGITQSLSNLAAGRQTVEEPS
jgi:hypothetical protein